MSREGNSQLGHVRNTLRINKNHKLQHLTNFYFASVGKTHTWEIGKFAPSKVVVKFSRKLI